VLQIQPKLDGVYFNYAHLLMRVKEYQKSIEYFRRFLQFENISDNFYKKALQNIRICEYRDSMIKHPVPFNPVNLGSGINSELDEYWPAMTADEQYLFFTRKLDQYPEAKLDYYRYNEDIFYSTNINNVWQPAIKLPPWLNEVDKNEGAITISLTENICYLRFAAMKKILAMGYATFTSQNLLIMNGNRQKTWGPRSTPLPKKPSLPYLLTVKRFISPATGAERSENLIYGKAPGMKTFMECP
jgi:tetratricopeptide (TPR) repeat protein